MAQNFIAVDRDQVFVAAVVAGLGGGDHLVWTVLESVEEMDLSAIFSVYGRMVMVGRRITRR